MHGMDYNAAPRNNVFEMTFSFKKKKRLGNYNCSNYKDKLKIKENNSDHL